MQSNQNIKAEKFTEDSEMIANKFYKLFLNYRKLSINDSVYLAHMLVISLFLATPMTVERKEENKFKVNVGVSFITNMPLTTLTINNLFFILPIALKLTSTKEYNSALNDAILAIILLPKKIIENLVSEVRNASDANFVNWLIQRQAQLMHIAKMNSTILNYTSKVDDSVVKQYDDYLQTKNTVEEDTALSIFHEYKRIPSVLSYVSLFNKPSENSETTNVNIKSTCATEHKAG